MTSPSQPTSPSVDAETLKNNLASSLVIAWDRYVSLFGEPPHGTGKQMRSLLSFVPTAALSAPRVEPVALPPFLASTSDAADPRKAHLVFREELSAEHHSEIAHRVIGAQPDTGVREALERIKNYPHNGDATAQGMAAIAREALTDWFDRLDFDRSNEATRHAEYAELMSMLAALPPDAGSQKP